MQITTHDISRLTTAVRRHEALLRYARYLLIYNIFIFLWVAIPQLFHVSSLRELIELAASRFVWAI